MCRAVLAVCAVVLWCAQSWAETQNERAVRLYREGEYVEAEKAARRAIAEALKHHGSDSAEMASALNNLAEINVAVGRLPDAESLHRQALAIRKKSLGPDHLITASSLSNLAAVCATQRKWTEAGLLYKQALEVREKILGPDHLLTAFSLRNLGAVYASQHRFTEAEPLLAQALAIRERIAGPNHPDTMQTRKDLEFVLTNRARSTRGKKDDVGISESAQLTRRTNGPKNGGTSLRHDSERGAEDPAAQKKNTLAVGFILACVALLALAGLMVRLSNSHLGETRKVTQDGGHSSPPSDAVGALVTAPRVRKVAITQTGEAVAAKSTDNSADALGPLPVVTHKSSTPTSSPERRTTSSRFDSRKKEDSAIGLGAFFTLLCWVLAIGGCCYVVASRHPYDPNWRNNPKYDNYDYPLSPDDGGYIGVP